MGKSVVALDSKVVAIAGGARGIGRAVAAVLVAQGARVAIGDIDAELVLETASRLGGDVVGVEVDVTSRESFGAFLDEAERRLGAVDALVNCAGVMPVGELVSQRDAVSSRVLDVNLGGTILGCKLALERMLPRGEGRIVNLAPLPARVFGAHTSVVYAAAGGGVRALTRALREELEGSGVAVHVVLAGPTDTEMMAGMKWLPGLGPVAPEAVAKAVVAALRGECADVSVPGMWSWMLRLLALRLVPGRWLPGQPDALARAAYEARIAPPEQAGSDRAATVASAAASVADAIRGADA